MRASEVQEMVFANEFARVRITRVVGKCGVRLQLTDLETSATTFVDPLELASLCDWPEDERRIVVSGPMYNRAKESQS
ncbi:hypothetical protein [Rhodococcus artemisiae]|uniref:Uncharacterized protein n=1 Tax=Rhodococcus artemisiae TaxID=714159 RepID=A0ABU7LFS5_9NOCA|nr:hypothetical protein [Rhodococcus artemisiae]MEE2060414.1 hypothetical protein [Rhodococcus artemisiae]